jgi:hypothetical protein
MGVGVKIAMDVVAAMNLGMASNNFPDDIQVKKYMGL